MWYLDQFLLLLWKNFVLQKRRPVATAFELLIPSLFAALLVIIRNQIEFTNYPNATTWREFSVDHLPEFHPSIVPKDQVWTIAYVPGDKYVIEMVMDDAKTVLNQEAKTKLEQQCNFETSTILNPIQGFVSAATMPPAIQIAPSAMQETSTLQGVISSLSPSMLKVLEEIVKEHNSTSLQFLALSIANDNLDSLMENVTKRYMENVMDCISNLIPIPSEYNKNEGNTVETVDMNNASQYNRSTIYMKEFFENLDIIPKVKILGFPTESDFLSYAKNDTNLKEILAAVIFEGDIGNNTLPSNLSLTLRFHADPINVKDTDSSAFSGIANTWHTTNLFPPDQLPGPREQHDHQGGKPGYYKEGFLAVLHAVNQGIYNVFKPSYDINNNILALKRFPYPPYKDDTFILAIQRTLPLLIMLSFFYTSLIIVRSVVHEKESKMKEYMLMMGLANWLHWLAWFLKYMLFLSISCIVMVGFYKIETTKGSVLTNTDVSIFFVFLLLFTSSTITFCFLISTFFSKANVGAAAGGVLYGMTYMPYMFMQQSYSSLGRGLKLFACIISTTAMSSGCNIIGQLEGKGTGLQWSNVGQYVTIDDNIKMSEIMLFLLFDTIFYMLLALYIEAVWPGDYGMPKPWYFPFTKLYWFGASSDLKLEVDEEMRIHSEREDDEYFEAEPTGIEKIVAIKNLTKIFKTGSKIKVAVNKLSVNMYEGQVTVLLGHNGAGKTTTMSMLTGFYPPSSGEASVMGYSIKKDISSVRKSLGYCPQFNILFDLLTVREHLYFFGRLKGLSIKQAKKQCEEMTNDLKLCDKIDAKSKTLSGGMKRKLSVGIAFSAGSRYVILDEPTSGMDPAARRSIWEVIQKFKGHCSLLVSTHFMDEADLLGDRIAIMANGRLRCAGALYEWGSSVFLKSKFGVGYHVVLTKSPECDVNKLVDVFHEHVTDCKLERVAGGEVSFVLPFHSSSVFPKLFSALDSQSETLGIFGYGATVTTLEEVFLRVTEDADSNMSSVSRRLSFSKSMMMRRGSTSSEESDQSENAPLHPQSSGSLHSKHLNSGAKLWFQQFYSLVVKHMLHSRRNYKVAISQILVPVVFVLLAIISARFPPFEQTNVKLDLMLDSYGENNVYFNMDNNSFSSHFGNIYKNQFEGTLENPVKINGSMEEYLSHESLIKGGDFNMINLAAATFSQGPTPNSSFVISWFNDQGYHTPANSLVYYEQAMIRLVNPNVNLKFFNFPLPRNSTSRVTEQLIGSISGFMISFNTVLGFSFLAASFSLFLVRERVDRSALLQTLAGVEPFCFWLSSFLWDFVNFIAPCFLTMFLFFVFGVDEFNNHAGIVLLLFLLYCWASLPLMYLFSKLFTVPSTALVRITILNIITGLASIITMSVLRLLELTNVADGLNWLFLFMPQYCLGQGLADIYTNDKMVNACTVNILVEDFCRSLGITFQTNFLAWDSFGAGKYVTFLAWQGCLFFIILFLIEFDIPGMIRRLLPRWKNATFSQSPHVDSDDIMMDEDVFNEERRVNNTPIEQLVETDRLIIKNLRKVYNPLGKAFIAVDKLCFGIPKAECFGLLGINGAGKTTTFKMLTGDFRPSDGTAYLDAFDITINLRKAQQRMGYCPQFDALIEQMTGSETIRMFARLRGVPENEIPQCVQQLGDMLFFSEHLDKPCGTYSGGNRRKLSTAIALVGNPPVVLLDEPSTGMDPGARRKLWDAIANMRAGGSSIVITSHSMEECEALCTRIAIMVNGRLRCLGGPQHLKTKFGQGYTVEVKASKANMGNIKAQMNNYFPGCILKDENQGLYNYHVPQMQQGDNELKLAHIFEKMEKLKHSCNFGEYTVQQTSLEQVFLSLARWQREDNVSN